MSRFASHTVFRPRTLTALAVGALATAALLGSPAIATAAQPAADAPQTTVYYNYHELATDQGSRALYERITRAAREVCPAYSRDLTALAAAKECQRAAVAQAIDQIGSARLAAVHSQKLARRG